MRSKLVAILAPPLVVLVVLAVVGARERMAEADDARVVEELALLAAANADVVEELQAERTLWVTAAAGGSASGAELDAQRAATDEAIESLAAAMQDVDVDALPADLTETIGTVRSSAVDRVSAGAGEDLYDQMIEALVAVNAGIATAVAVPDLALAGADGEIIDSVIAEAGQRRADADAAVRLYLTGATGALLLALLLASIVARTITGPLRRLTAAAETLSGERLPALVEQLRNPREPEDAPTAEPATIDIESRDEIGILAEAFNSVQETTMEVAQEQRALLRKGISDIFVNLARRNQTLLDRQIEFIDGLERNEQDPDQLDSLFRLDHLATRMRRNAESLLVLAGAEPGRRRGSPVPLLEVVRVAIGEVDDFARIELLAVDDVTVRGDAAVDVAHLLAELMENATQFSPPDTSVDVVGHRGKDGGYVLSVSDQGIGMTDEQLGQANQELADPPLVGLAMSPALGFIVIGRLAERFGISVRLVSSPAGGVTALVELPPGLVAEGASSQPAPSGSSAAPETLLEALPDGGDLEHGLASLLHDDAEPVEPAAPPSPSPIPPPPPPPPADVERDPGSPLARRTPRAATQDDQGPRGGPPGLVPTHRSPEQVRQMLSRYRSGLDRGRSPAPDDDGGTVAGPDERATERR